MLAVMKHSMLKLFAKSSEKSFASANSNKENILSRQLKCTAPYTTMTRRASYIVQNIPYHSIVTLKKFKGNRTHFVSESNTTTLRSHVLFRVA